MLFKINICIDLVKKKIKITYKFITINEKSTQAKIHVYYLPFPSQMLAWNILL